MADGDRGERLPPPTVLSPEQEAAAKAFEAARGRPPFGPFATLLHSPELMLRASAMGEYLRYKSSLPPRLSEFAILIVAREWSQAVEWEIHHPIAIKAGVPAPVADAIARGDRPASLSPKEAALYDVIVELQRTRNVSDDTFARAKAAFGERGVFDIVGIAGYYGLLAMAMNVAQTAPSDTDGARLPEISRPS